jgi:hypothetical protein
VCIGRRSRRYIVGDEDFQIGREIVKDIDEDAGGL